MCAKNGQFTQTFVKTWGHAPSVSRVLHLWMSAAKTHLLTKHFIPLVVCYKKQITLEIKRTKIRKLSQVFFTQIYN